MTARRHYETGLFARLGPRDGLDAFPAVYTRKGRTAHLLPALGSPNVYGPALCGLWPDERDLWFGTGTEDEYDTARGLPLCRICTQVQERMRRTREGLAPLWQDSMR